MGETEGAGEARVMLDGVPILDVQRARSGEEGWVEVAVRRNRASGRVRCLPVAGKALDAPRAGEFWFPEGGAVESLRTAEGFALRILSGRVKVLLPEAKPAADVPPNKPGEPPPGAPSDPTGDAPPTPAAAPETPAPNLATGIEAAAALPEDVPIMQAAADADYHERVAAAGAGDDPTDGKGA